MRSASTSFRPRRWDSLSSEGAHMTSSVVRRLICVCAIVAAPIAAFAQEAVFSGTVTDSTGAILPGVTLRAVLEATGIRFASTNDQSRGYRIHTHNGGF